MTRARRLVLIGGGHAHLEVLRQAAHRPFAAELVLVSPYARQLYSGMMPAQLRGAHRESALAVELPGLCRAARARFVEAAVERIEVGPEGSAVHANGAVLSGDVVSLDIGATTAALDTPGVREHAYMVRPLSRWRALLARLAALTGGLPIEPGSPAPRELPLAGCVVGGGLAGVELALALAARCLVAGRTATVTLVERESGIARGLGASAARRVGRLLAGRGVRTVTGCTVARVAADMLTLSDGTQLASDLTIWATGAAALPLIRDSGLPVDPAGFLQVDASLRSVTGAMVWGAGDCVVLTGAPWMPKSGVYAVRAAPVLAYNLRAAAERRWSEMRHYDPQRHALAILDSSDGRGLLHWRGLTSHSAWALRLKQAIDHRFVRRYQQTAGRG